MNPNDYQRPTWKEFLSALGLAIVAFIVIAALVFLCGIVSPSNANAQSVIRQGNVFIQQPSEKSIKKDSAVTLTQYTYVIKDVKYPVYKSSRGSYFIIRTNKKGEQYRKYVTKEILGT